MTYTIGNICIRRVGLTIGALAGVTRLKFGKCMVEFPNHLE